MSGTQSSKMRTGQPGLAPRIRAQRFRVGARTSARVEPVHDEADGNRNLLRTIARLLGFAFLLTLLLAPAAMAVQPDEIMSDPKLEARARELSAELRCLVCQNQSIDDSDASLAKDIRLLIRERIAKGESNAEVRDFLVSRYGDFILLKPPFKRETLLLWLSAPLTLTLGGLAIALASRRAKPATPALSAAEERRLAEIAGAEGDVAGPAQPAWSGGKESGASESSWPVGSG
jgi:cytochrome c-type biogenesis protein CcmH